MLKKIFFALFIFFLTTNTVIAQINLEIVDIPDEVTLDKEFNVGVEVAASPSSTYYVKVRAGDSLTSLRSALTYQTSTKTWLSDTNSWSKFPVFETDSNGFWEGVMKAKFKSSATLGENLLLLRIRKIETSKNLDSATKEIIVVENTQPSLPINTNQTVSNSIKVTLNEFSPSPLEGKEWVEIYNPHSKTADIGNWSIDDIDGGSKPTLIPTGKLLKSKGYFVLYFSNKLNNTGDSVRLIDPRGKEIEKYSYGEVTPGTVYAKTSDGKWKTTLTPTPGQKNNITSPLTKESTNATSVSTAPTKTFISPKSIGLTDFPNILGITIPNSFENQNPKDQPNQTKGIVATNPSKQASFSAIMVGIGLILLGAAVGLPLLKRNEVEIEVNEN